MRAEKWLVGMVVVALAAGCAELPFLAATDDGRRGGYRIKGGAAGPGPVFLAGSGDHPPGQIQRFRDLAGGPSAYLVVGPFAGGAPAAAEAREAFFAGGATRVDLLDGADAEADARLISKADGIYFVGGSAEIAARKMKPYAEVLRSAWLAGAAIGGTSAGAMVWGERLIVKGEAREAMAKGVWAEGGGLEVVPGLAFAAGLLVDPHFNERGRFPRLWVASGATALVGVGVDENTAAVWTPDDHKITAVGAGTVTLVRHDGANKGQDARVAVLAEGRSVDLGDWGVPRFE